MDRETGLIFFNNDEFREIVRANSECKRMRDVQTFLNNNEEVLSGEDYKDALSSVELLLYDLDEKLYDAISKLVDSVINGMCTRNNEAINKGNPNLN